MKVKVKLPLANVTGTFEAEGKFVGLYISETDDVLAMIKLDGYGMYLRAVHPSNVILVEGENE